MILTSRAQFPRLQSVIHPTIPRRESHFTFMWSWIFFGRAETTRTVVLNTVVTESGVRKIKYNAKVYLKDPGDSVQMITKLTTQTTTTAFKETQPLHGYTFSNIQTSYLDKIAPCGHIRRCRYQQKQKQQGSRRDWLWFLLRHRHQLVERRHEKRRVQISPRDTRPWLTPSRQLVSK